jgi:hypothetical protein
MVKVFLIELYKFRPLHVLLLPLYFITQKSLQFAGMLDTQESVPAYLLVLGLYVVLFLFSYAFRNRKLNIAIFITLVGTVFLFFGDIKFSLEEIAWLHILSKYRVLLPLLMILMIAIIVFLRKSRHPVRVNLFLNLLFTVFLIWDLFILAFPNLNPRMFSLLQKPVSLNVSSLPGRDSLPSIYYIVPDGYPSTQYQQETLGVERNMLTDSLEKLGFYEIPDTRSNYSNTAFSLAATLGMNYVEGMGTSKKMAPYMYNKSMQMVKNTPLISFLKQQGYDIFNYSIFDLDKQPALRKNVFLSMTTRQLIFHNIFWNCIKRDLFWQLIPGYLERKKRAEAEAHKRVFRNQHEYNNRVLSLIGDLVRTPPVSAPRFMYAHLMMPHYPYFCDSAGRLYPDSLVFGDKMINDKERFTMYLLYTNKMLLNTVEQIMQHDSGKKIIIIQSDHGMYEFSLFREDDAFRNFTAIYTPDQDYAGFYNGMSNVNTFRIILNQYFGQDLPVLQDKQFFIR